MGLTATELSLAVAVPRVLVADDEPALVSGLRIMLRGAGYAVETARTAVDVVALVAERPPDVLMLDLALPPGDGVEVCREIRRFTRLPIVVMSPADAERENVRALNAGADEYLAKPFRVDELLARLRGVLASSAEGAGSSRVEIGELVIDLARRRASLAGAAVLLAPADFEFVRVLAQRPGRPITDRQLLSALWGPDYERDTHRLRVAVARIRAKLERDPSRPEYLITEPGIGYRLRVPREVLT
ncbi:MAG TPA: response regulator transcription factor [Solirubrobacteraceae bacterium]|nr:response regulator transcription factor [Solirubrobacteraceae bacterium]